jgi:protein-S-isoprenylcysteine O-methyltransferase Ste14
MDTAFLLLSICFLVCLAVRDGYELLKERRAIREGSRPAFIVVLIAMCGLWISWFILCRLDPHRLGVPEAAQWAGRIVMGFGMVLAVGALIQLRGLEGIDHLVTRGLFKRLRHPMYLGFMLWIVGWCIAWDAATGMVLGIPALLSILWWRHLEDRRLGAQFGQAYEEYRKSTWF